MRRRWLTANKAFPSKGKGLCRVCGIAVRDGGMASCSRNCSDRINLSCSPTTQRYAVQRRDNGVCAKCGCDTAKLNRVLRYVSSFLQTMRWVRTHRYERFGEILTQLGIPRSRWPGSLWDMAHKRAVCDGGGIRPGMTVEAIMGNLETLCLWCHREDTRELAGLRARQTSEVRQTTKGRNDETTRATEF